VPVVSLAYTFARLSQFITGSLQEFIVVGIKNKVITITGASSGIGEAMAVLLSQLGAKLVLGARGTERPKKLTASIVAVGGDAVCVTTDVTRREDLVRLMILALERYERLDVLVSNAGTGPLSSFDDLKVDEWDMMIDVNLRGVLHGIAAALPVFRKQGFGHFVHVVSTAGIKIIPLQGVYAATKKMPCVPSMRRFGKKQETTARDWYFTRFRPHQLRRFDERFGGKGIDCRANAEDRNLT
jgi:NADP-dependent 3-hydroxy acid dehydrogenase YdfG